jgi:hypothetical protein
MTTFIRITQAQADAIRGKYGDYHALEPIPLAESEDYILTDAVLSHPAFAGAAATLAALPTFPAWETGVAYGEDGTPAVVSYGDRLWRIVQPHTSQVDWTPDVVPALWRSAHEPGEIPPWVQPTGAHDAYELGAKVTHNGQVWESQYAANVWEPGIFGWIEVT